MVSTLIEVSALVDHTLLRVDCRTEDIKKICQEAVDFGFVAVCIPPYFVSLADRLLRETDVKIATVIGFPTGFSATAAKVEEIKRAVEEGAHELDIVVNIAAVKNKNWNTVSSDIDSCTSAAHMRGRKVKIILETTLLDKEEIEQLCSICAQHQVDFVKTSTGTQGGVTVETVALLRQLLPDSIKIKASGGIRTRKQVMDMMNAGADRIGTSSGVKLMEE